MNHNLHNNFLFKVILDPTSFHCKIHFLIKSFHLKKSFYKQLIEPVIFKQIDLLVAVVVTGAAELNNL